MTYRTHVKTEYLSLTGTELLQARPRALLGVSEAADTALADLKIETIYDLALSTIFANAGRLLAASEGIGVYHFHGRAPSDMVDRADGDKSPAILVEEPITALVGIGAQNGPMLQDALNLRSIRDLALWPPYAAARHLLVSILSPGRAPGHDKDAPADLLPRSGQHATQQFSYSSTVLIESKPSTTRQWDGGPIDVTVLDETGFKDVAFGAILTFTQRWNPRAVALGQLLHSLPLAPGESTRLALLDWRRKSAGSTLDTAEQAEAISQSMAQATAISEVTSAVATEFQEGSSTSGARSVSVTGSVVAFPGIGPAATTINASAAGTYTTSSGKRTAAAEAAQNIGSRTQQNSALTRSRRAAVVSEVSDGESQNISTRAVTNHNHMHSMSIQYYEVVQVYETVVDLSRCERCIFIPMKLIDFGLERNIRRYLRILILSALDRETRLLLMEYRRTAILEFATDRFAKLGLERILAGIQDWDFQLPGGAADFGLESVQRRLEKRIAADALEARARVAADDARFNYERARRRGLVSAYDRDELTRLSLDARAAITAVAWDPKQRISSVDLHLTDGSTIRAEGPADMNAADASGDNIAGSVGLDRLRSISVSLGSSGTEDPSDFTLLSLHVLLVRGNRRHWLNLVFAASGSAVAGLTVVRFRPPIDLSILSERLKRDRLHYSQQVWLRADRQALIMQLAPYSYRFPDGDTIRVVDHIDPVPVSVAGNYLAFRFTYEKGAEWVAWRDKQREEARPRTDIVPVPTGGVFAEAVLGEFNAAEKIDATRFWRWEQSPIPNQAAAIGPITARAGEPLAPARPGTLPDSVLKLLPIPQLPSLATSEQILKAVAANAIFRDMSGLDITTKLAEASLAAAQAGDSAAAIKAQEALANVSAAIEAAVSAFSKSAATATTGTELGALLNSLSGGGQGSSSPQGQGPNGGQSADGAEQMASMALEIVPLIAKLAPILAAL